LGCTETFLELPFEFLPDVKVELYAKVGDGMKG
jgi:hypothetical protein